MRPQILVCSDFDRTLKIDNEVSERNRLAIRKLQDSGHLFVIDTGRCFQNFQQEMKKNDFQFDYAICGDGLQIVDKSFNVLATTSFSQVMASQLAQSIVEGINAFLNKFSVDITEIDTSKRSGLSQLIERLNLQNSRFLLLAID